MRLGSLRGLQKDGKTAVSRIEIGDSEGRVAGPFAREKRDRRYGSERDEDGRRVGKLGLAYETEALRRAFLEALFRTRLNELLPEPLERVRVREGRQRTEGGRLMKRGRRWSTGPTSRRSASA